MTLVCLIVGGAPAPHVNETHYLTKAKHYWDAAYCPGDAFLDSADPHVVFYWAVGPLTRWFSLTTVAWLGRLASWGLVAWGWRRVAHAALNKRLSALSPLVAAFAVTASAAVWLVLIDSWSFAGEWVVGGVEGKSLAFGFALAGLADVIAARWRTCWPWFGLAAAFHVLVGGWFVAAAGLVWLVQPRSDRTTLMAMAPGLLLGGALALAGLVPALALERGVPEETTNEAAQIYVYRRLPHHLAPLSLSLHERTRRLSCLAILVGGVLLVVASARDPRMRRCEAFAGASLLFVATGLVIELVLDESQFTSAAALRYYWFRLADVALPAAIALGVAAALVGEREGYARNWPWGRLVGAALVVVAGASLGKIVVARSRDPRPPADNKTEDLDAWRDACAWIDRECPADALFLVPRHAQSFKWYASRADVANWKDVPQDAAGVVAWFTKCEDIFGGRNAWGELTMIGSPAQLGTQRVRELCRKYGATHVICQREPALALPMIYANEAYAVYSAK